MQYRINLGQVGVVNIYQRWSKFIDDLV